MHWSLSLLYESPFEELLCQETSISHIPGNLYINLANVYLKMALLVKLNYTTCTE